MPGTRSPATNVELIQNKFYVICADTALAPLLAAGLEPDLVISVDSGRGTAYHFVAAARIRQPFLFPVLSYLAGSRVLPYFFRKRYYYRSTLPLDQWLASGPLGQVEEWRNPARNPLGLALHVARLLGAPVLYTAGADLRAQGDASHTRGTGYTEYILPTLRRCYPITMYRPGGYRTLPDDERRTLKNRLSLRGAQDMATGFGLRLLAIGDLPPAEQLELLQARPQANGAATRTRTREIPERLRVSVPASELRAYLRATRSQLRADAFAGPGVSERDLDRWLTILN
jgi:hypothetical protein